MEDLSLHILDIAENSVEAQAKRIEIKISEDAKKDLLSLEIADDGKGMDKETLRKALDPFFTTKKVRRFGLGLSLLAEAARAANGKFHIESKPGKGTKVRAIFQMSHIDRKPLGDIARTLIAIIAGHPEINIRYRHQVNGSLYTFDAREIKSHLNGISITSPEAMKYIRNNIKQGLACLRRQK